MHFLLNLSIFIPKPRMRGKAALAARFVTTLINTDISYNVIQGSVRKFGQA